MSNYAIQVNNLGKMYRIGGQQQSYDTFREIISRAALSPFKKIRDLARGQSYAAAGLHEEVWALKDVTFDIKHGEVVGIIGRNGAGKSTLLKILSRITDPSVGYADVYGRVGALLEVGTGFHPELTGRENVYLNGAILGMSRRDIDRKFDEIVDFAGVEKFIDTPVKHYSSGMGLRLGFAVAAHLEPEILVVDEVLAVGDAEFQKKCLGKMSDVAGEGRTVLFVSHNMAMISRLCDTAVLLEQGEVVTRGDINHVIATYASLGNRSSLAENIWDIDNAPGTDTVQLLSARVFDDKGQTCEAFDVSAPINVEIKFRILKENAEITPNIRLNNSSSVVLLHSLNLNTSIHEHCGIYTSYCQIPGHLLNEDTYYLDIGLTRFQPVYYHVWERDAITFVVSELEGIGIARGTYPKKLNGAFRPLFDWSTKFDG